MNLRPEWRLIFHTGLTAAFTILDIHENTDLVQIRPAFSDLGNILSSLLPIATIADAFNHSSGFLISPPITSLPALN